MGYPTSPYATSRARTATGLSSVAHMSGASLNSQLRSAVQGVVSTYVPEVPAPANWEIPGISQPDVNPDWGDAANRPGPQPKPAPAGSPPPAGSPKPVGAPPPARLPSPNAGPGPAEFPSPYRPSVPTPSSLARGALGAMRGMNAAMWALLALQLAEEARQWARERAYGRYARAGDDWSWPDPTDPYWSDGTQVIVCEGVVPEAGPYLFTGLCGLLGNAHPELERGVDHEYSTFIDDMGNPWSLEHTQWQLRWYLNFPTSNIYSPAVNADYWKFNTPPLPATPPEHWPSPVPPTDPSVWPSNAPLPGANPAPGVPPMVDPLSNPVRPGQLSPTPMRVPYALIPHVGPNPDRSPTEQPQRGNALPPPAGGPPSPPPPGGGRDPWRPDRRPRRREKEKKLGAKGAVAIGVAMFATEATDVIDALWDALPDYNKSRRFRRDLTAADKYADVYKHWETVDAEEAIENLIINGIEDAVIGGIHAAIDKALGPVATTKWQNNPSKPKFEKDLAKAVNDLVDPWVRGAVEPDIDRGTAGQLGNYFRSL